MDEYSITMEALADSLEADANAVLPVKYRDAYRHTWDGHGDKPDWRARAIYAGQNIDHFRCYPLFDARVPSIQWTVCALAVDSMCDLP